MSRLTKQILRFLPVILTLIVCPQLHAQQLPVYSQYMMNAFLLNPAVAGHEGYTAINVTGREQWLGMKDAPGTYAVSAQTRLLKNSYISRSASIRKRKRVMSRSGRVGYGLYAYTDMAGAFNRTDQGLQFSSPDYSQCPLGFTTAFNSRSTKTKWIARRG
jgi:type IX secretion system PorP/SprF family membrane protein